MVIARNLRMAWLRVECLWVVIYRDGGGDSGTEAFSLGNLQETQSNFRKCNNRGGTLAREPHLHIHSQFQPNEMQ